MKKETLRYQRLAGIITESQYNSKLNEFKDLSYGDSLYDIVVDTIENSGDDYLRLANYIGGAESEITLEVEKLAKAQESHEGQKPSDAELKSLIKIVTKNILDDMPSETIQNAKEEMNETN